jgi:hypothetical protein
MIWSLDGWVHRNIYMGDMASNSAGEYLKQEKTVISKMESDSICLWLLVVLLGFIMYENTAVSNQFRFLQIAGLKQQRFCIQFHQPRYLVLYIICIHTEKMPLLLTTKRHFTVALWMPVKTIRIYPDIMERIRWSMVRCVEAYIESHGGHLSTYYKCTLSAITHELNVSRYMLIWTLFLVLLCETCTQSLSAPLSYTFI